MTKQTRWLDDDEQDLWRMLLDSMRKIDRGMEDSLLYGSDLSLADFSILVPLSEVDDQALRLRDLCKNLGWDRSRASHQVNRMLKRGLVTKGKCAGDARGVLIELTDEGRRRLERAAPAHVESVRRLVFDHLSDADRAGLRRFCEGVLAVDNIPGQPGFVPDARLGEKVE
ncbi:MarR family winged helix-turn-helix transcriptional regulator [Corynebacterium confusum]|uniref:MarR family winged helix-turn-helix transcriptional regulator n=1 Tax=uncultured Corynebacterium sp. TaxID=159447 RepID=UPI0025FCD64F|nr:MarR family transcriptional regulator [uncultured Corynebacterium sp.]